MLKRALTLANIQGQTIELIPFKNHFLDAFGKPQNRGVWFIWGGSGSGKSTFVMMLVKELAMLGYKTLYNLLEEEPDDSDYINRTVLLNMGEVPTGNFLTAAYNYDDLVLYLKKRNAPKAVVIDSLTYFKIDFEKYLNLKHQFKNTIFIIVGHAEGKRPRTKFEEDVMYDAKMKIFIDGYQALCKGRTIGKNGGVFTIWEEGRRKLQGAS